LRRVQSWMDDECLFALHYLEPMDR
jgi:hypothetical protein